MNSKIVFLFAFAVIFSGVLILTSESETPQTTVEAPPVEPTVTFWVAARPMEKAGFVKRQDIKRITLPASKAAELGVTENIDFSLALDAIAAANIDAGKAVFPQDFLTQEDPGYIDTIIQPEQVAYPLEIKDPVAMLSNLSPGDYIDLVILTSSHQNVVEEGVNHAFKSLEVAPLLSYKRLLSIKQSAVGENSDEVNSATLFVELSREDVARMLIAKRVGEIEVFKSSGLKQASESRAVTRDVLSGYHTVNELRGANRPRDI